MISNKSTSTSQSQFSKSPKYYADLCKAFLSSDIRSYKLKSPDFGKLLIKYTNFETPEESTLRKLYVPPCCEETVRKIRTECEN